MKWAPTLESQLGHTAESSKVQGTDSLCNSRKSALQRIQQYNLPHMIHLIRDERKDAPRQICRDKDIFRACQRQQTRPRHLTYGIDDGVRRVHVIVVLSVEVQGLVHAADVRGGIAGARHAKEEPDQ